MSLPKDGSAESNAAGGANTTAGYGDGNPKEGSREIQDGRIVSEAMDWCKSPDAIVPYKIWAWQSEAANLANSVRLSDDRSHVVASLVLHCYGDEAGVGGGVLSGTHNAECEPLTYSSTVRAENRNMVRHDDFWFMNHKNTYGRLDYRKDVNSYSTPQPPTITPDMQLAGSQAADSSASNGLTQVAQNVPPNTATDASTPGTPSAPSSSSSQGTLGAAAIALPAAGGAALAGGESTTGGILGAIGQGASTIGRGVVWAGEGIGAGTIGLAGVFLLAMTTSTAKDDVVRVTDAERQKKCPCTVEPYSIQKKKCPVECPSSQAHHIVPDYLLGPGNRKEREQGSRLYADDGKPLPSFEDGPAICLIGNKSTQGTPHNVAHEGDSKIQEKAAGNSGVIPLGEAVDISVLAALKARPECSGEILSKTHDAFGQFNENTNVRGTNDPVTSDSPSSKLLNTTKPGSER